jgi:hypothetical protein
VADAVSVSSLGTSWDGTSSVSWGGDLEPAPDTDCQTEMDTFRTAIEAYKAMGPHPWPEGDAAAVRLTLIRAGLLMPDMPLSHNSATSPPKANTWYYDASTHWFTSRCDA